MLRLLGVALLALVVPATALSSALVESVKGSVQSGARELRQGERVFPGATLSVGQGAQLRLRFDDGMQVQAEQNTRLGIVDFRYADGGPNDRAVLDLLAGAARIVTGEVARRSPTQFFLRTPQSSLGVQGASDFSVVVANASYVSVALGTVVSANRAGVAPVESGSVATIASAGVLPDPNAPLPPRVISLLAGFGAPTEPRAEMVETPEPAAPEKRRVATAPSAPRADTFFFAGFGAGRSDIDENMTRGLITSGSTKGDGTGFKVFAGYQFHPNLGVEAAFLDLGEAKYEGDFNGTPITDGRLKVTGINLAALGRVPLTERFSLFAKLGLFIWEAEASDTAAGVGFSTSTDGRHASFGVGASYDITRSVAMRAEFENFRIDKDNATLISIGVAVNF